MRISECETAVGTKPIMLKYIVIMYGGDFVKGILFGSKSQFYSLYSYYYNVSKHCKRIFHVIKQSLLI